MPTHHLDRFGIMLATAALCRAAGMLTIDCDGRLDKPRRAEFVIQSPPKVIVHSHVKIFIKTTHCLPCLTSDQRRRLGYDTSEGQTVRVERLHPDRPHLP